MLIYVQVQGGTNPSFHRFTFVLRYASLALLCAFTSITQNEKGNSQVAA